VSVAWDNFIATVDPVQLERERMRVLGSLVKERPGSRQHHEVMWAHQLRRLEFRRQLSLSPVPFWFSEKQLQIARDAQQAVIGAVSDSAGRVASPTHTNTSTTLKPANGRTVSQTSSTNKWIPESTKREEAA
jgi:hypothetical protein